MQHQLELRLGQAGVDEGQSQGCLLWGVRAHPHQLEGGTGGAHSLEPPGPQERGPQGRRRGPW
ncbi:hypothetical protein [Micrococcus luteus]|uniref:hypothetical protein n=1 Tax=Micrococcus luteus TaxID=1270 RepID=UPI0019D0F870|nr:hypothetical protein [Micrococcus luteus]MBN6750493.1 hypothetical protein [Micrococcus luteus]MBN6760273.1 hypothetical protein [Micrococcus luteus]MBN6802026.1 hypothetical protein [Micrococcus luteus]MDT1992261.1 hypothetical protein [Micrococcus luteus]